MSTVYAGEHRVYSHQKRIALAFLVSVTLAIVTVSSAIVLSYGVSERGALNPNVPGAAISDSPFAEISANTTTPSSSAAYGNAYTTTSEKPFVIEVDLRESAVIDETTAKLNATRFIESTFPQDEFSQLEIDDRSTSLYGVLPRWSISFRNNTITTHTRIEATVYINAISGSIIGYTGEPILKQGPVDSVSAAETHAIAMLDYFGFVIPSHARYEYHIDNYSNENTIIYSLTFRNTVDGALIDSSFGTLNLQIDGRNGGLRYLMLEWMSIDQIPTTGIISADKVAPNATLSLQAIPMEGQEIYSVDIEAPFKMQLVWLEKDSTTGKEILYDAFSGEILEYRASFGQPPSGTETIAVAPLIGALGFALVAYWFGRSRMSKLIQA